MQSTERWLPFVGYEGLYEVSDMGRVRSIDRVVIDTTGKTRRLRGRILAQTKLGNTPYLKVVLCRAPSQTTRSVHSLVLEAFVGPRPDGMEACHGFGGQVDNRLVNLRWDTLSENNYDMVRQGTHRAVQKTRCPRGHLLRAPNLTRSFAVKGHRTCLACSRARAVLQYASGAMGSIADEKYSEIMRGEVAL